MKVTVERETVDAVVDGYGRLAAHQLSELSHRERPWKDARRGRSAGERGSVEITHEAMAEHYDRLVPSEDGIIIITDIAPEDDW